MGNEKTAQVVFVEFDGKQGTHAVQVCDAVGEQGIYLWGPFGCGKTRPSREEAALEYLGGRTFVSIK